MGEWRVPTRLPLVMLGPVTWKFSFGIFVVWLAQPLLFFDGLILTSPSPRPHLLC